MMSESSGNNTSTVEAATAAFRNGYTPLVVRAGAKAPVGSGWGNRRWATENEVRAEFETAIERGDTNIGLLLGEASRGLVDVDLDHPKTLRLSEYFLPTTPMRSGRVGRPRSHLWYIVKEDPPAYRKHVLHTGETLVELRISGRSGTTGYHQTVIPPSIWTDKSDPSHIERYRWHGQPWGGTAGPSEVNGKKLATQVALLALGAALLDNWPHTGSRHDAYLALAGGLLRYGDGVHPWWEKNLPILIGALAGATDDEDGPEARIKEVMGTTIKRLKEGGKASGFPKLGEIIGEDYTESVRRLAREVVETSGFRTSSLSTNERVRDARADDTPVEDEEPLTSDHERDPMGERSNSWEPVDLEPYLTGELSSSEPELLERIDPATGEVAYLLYANKVNSLFGLSESAKTWIALTLCGQELAKGNRIAYIDLEDDPETMIRRLRDLGNGDNEISTWFKYIHPEGPLDALQSHARRGLVTTEAGRRHAETFHQFMVEHSPRLLVLDGLNVMFGIHGHDTNEAAATSVVFSWLSKLCRDYHTTVLVIDHTGKHGGAGASMVGAHQKTAQVRGAALRAEIVPGHRPVKGRDGGIVNLVVFKDSPGSVRGISVDTGGDEMVCATVTIDSEPQEGMSPTAVRVQISAPSATLLVTDMPTYLGDAVDRQEAVVALFCNDPDKQLKGPEISDLLQDLGDKVSASTRDRCLTTLCDQERLTAQGEKSGRIYQLGPREGGHPRV